MKLARLFAMIRCEAKLHWRRRGLLVILLALAVVVIGTGLIQRSELQRLNVSLTPEHARQIATATLLTIGPVAWVLLTIMLPPVLAEAIPKDQQFGVRELLDSLPFGPGLYLTGKLLGVWASVMLGFGVFALLAALVWLPILGPFNLGIYLDMWLVGLLPLAIFTSAMSTLLPAGQPTRRRAVLVGVALAALIVFAAFSAQDLDAVAVQMWRFALNPGAWLWVLFQQRDLATGSLCSAFPRLVPRLIAFEALQVALAWLMIWGWMKWKENTQ